MVEVMSEAVIREFNRDYGYIDADTMFVKRLRLLELSDRQIAGVITILQTICKGCMDAPSGCSCQRDEYQRTPAITRLREKE